MHNMPRSMQVEHERAEKYAEQTRAAEKSSQLEIEAKQVDNEKNDLWGQRYVVLDDSWRMEEEAAICW